MAGTVPRTSLLGMIETWFWLPIIRSTSTTLMSLLIWIEKVPPSLSVSLGVAILSAATLSAGWVADGSVAASAAAPAETLYLPGLSGSAALAPTA
jgi:hypothetical protein